MDSYYQTELTYLRDMGREFAARHPSLAGLLAERSTDPDVERLLEGFAFVAARLRRRIDDAAPELIESLTELLLPHALRPTPAATIVEFQAASRRSRGNLRVERGARLQSSPVRGTRCTFTTSRALEVSPLRLVSQRLDAGTTTRPELTLRFEAEPGSEQPALGTIPLTFHLHGELATTTQLYLWLVRHLRSASLRVPGGETVELGAHAVRAVGFSNDHGLLPWPAFSSHSARVLHEYFTLPAKFLFFEVSQLERAAHLVGDTFELVLRFDRPPRLLGRLSPDTVRLHCVPAVNLFEAGAEPVRAGTDERATLLRAAGIEPEHMEVFSVEAVTGIARAAERKTYDAFHSFRHAHQDASESGYYKLTRQPSPVEQGVHTYLTLRRSPNDTLERGVETLSIELLCTNRNLPLELGPGDLTSPTSDLPSGLTFANIARLSAPRRVPLGSDLLWHFTSHLACTRRSLADREVLQALLSLYGTTHGSEAHEARVSRAKIEAIRSVQVETITRVIGGVAARGSLYCVALDQSGFASEGDAFLFGTVLSCVFATDAQVNSFADLHLTLLPSELTWRFAAEART